MGAAKKATLYIDTDDEITTIIDKVVSSKENIVALVLPKRATVLQSVVNMKLLKRSADTEKKKIVLITSDSSVVPLAGIAAIHVAKTLQSKPEIPKAPETEDASVVDEDEDITIDKSKSLAALSGDEDEVAEVPEIPEQKDKISNKKIAKKNKKLKIPDFSKFRNKLILAVLLLILLLVGWVIAAKVLPTAEIVIKTNTRTFSKDLTLTAALDPNEEGEALLAKIETIDKKDSETVPATGEKNVGKKADGNMTLTNCIDDKKSHTIPAGTGFTKDGKTFVTTKKIELERAVFDSNNECQGFDGFNRGDVDVTAAEGGSDFNISEGSYNSSIAGINAYGSKMKGGTDDIKQVVSQADIDKATQQLKDKLSKGTQEELDSRLTSQGFVPFESSYKAEDPITAASEAANSEASSVTVTATVIYRMTGVQKEGIEAKIKEAAQEDIDDTAQAVSDTGLSAATLRLKETSDGVYSLDVNTLVTAGPQLDSNVLIQEILGKKYGETEKILSGKAGVVDVDIEYSPVWVNSTPKNGSKVSIKIENIDENE